VIATDSCASPWDSLPLNARSPARAKQFQDRRIAPPGRRVTLCCALSGPPFRRRGSSSQGGALRLTPPRLPWADMFGPYGADSDAHHGATSISQSLVKNLMHLVYSTKHRQAWTPAAVRPRLFAYQAGIFQQWESPALIIGGVEDHVHALFSLFKNFALKKIVEEVKKGSSKWIKAEGSGNAEFYWQNGYSGFSVSQSNVEDVRRYIEKQEEHHRRMSFQDELRALYTRHEIEFDERYVWD
jgi:REP-associated tyrosine transposase